MPQTRERIQAVVNSARRLNSTPGETSTNFTYRFNRSVSRVTEILIQSIMFPFSFFSVNSSNNVLRVSRGTIRSITIPPGNYNTSTMISTLNLALNNNVDPTTGFVYGGFVGETFAVTFSPVTLRFTITNGNTFIIYDVATDPLSTLAKNLGFQATSALALSATSDSAINLAGPQYIRIESQFLSAPTQHKPLYADSSYSNTLFILPVNANFGSFVSTDIQIPIRLTYKFTIDATDIIDFTVVDEDGNQLDLNGNDWAMYIVMVTE